MPRWRWFDVLLIAVLMTTIYVATKMPSLGVQIRSSDEPMEQAQAVLGLESQQVLG